MHVESGVVKACACTGVRWCARCRDPELRRALGMGDPLAVPAWLGDALASERDTRVPTAPVGSPHFHVFDAWRQSAPTCPAFTGVRVYPEAITQIEAERLLSSIDSAPFSPSQSGKHKQHHGPRFNFTRRRMNADRFEGIPDYAHVLEARLRACVRDDEAGDAADRAACRAALAEYQTTDVFVLRYFEPERSNLDFHVDDLYAYGEAILDVSLDSESVLTFLGPFAPAECGQALECVRVPLPARSIAVVYGRARVAWQHAILPDDIRGLRTSITLRTLAGALRSSEAGQRVLATAVRRQP